MARVKAKYATPYLLQADERAARIVQATRIELKWVAVIREKDWEGDVLLIEQSCLACKICDRFSSFFDVLDYHFVMKRGNTDITERQSWNDVEHKNSRPWALSGQTASCRRPSCWQSYKDRWKRQEPIQSWEHDVLLEAGLALFSPSHCKVGLFIFHITRNRTTLLFAGQEEKCYQQWHLRWMFKAFCSSQSSCWAQSRKSQEVPRWKNLVQAVSSSREVQTFEEKAMIWRKSARKTAWKWKRDSFSYGTAVIR